MASVVVFGKPRAFETVEFIFDGNISTIENTHSEPILKPQQFNTSILHYFAREDYVGVECYTKAYGHTSERDGIVFGVGIKSPADINILQSVSNILLPFWTDFASDLLDNTNRFTDMSIIGRLQKTVWSEEEINKVRNVSLNSPKVTPNKNILLLVSTDLDDIQSVEDSIKKYEDVFISDSPDVFKESINEYVFKEADCKIYKIKGNKIVSYNENSTSSEKSVSTNSVFRPNKLFPIWGNNRKASQLIHGQLDNDGKGLGLGGNGGKKRWLIIILCIVVILFIVVICRYAPKVIEIAKKFKQEQTEQVKEDEPGKEVTEVGSDGVVKLQKVELKNFSSPIKKEVIDLDPEILPTNCIAYPGDFSYIVSDMTLAHIEKREGKIWLKIDNRPKQNTTIKVEVYLDNVCYGEQTYKIAQEEQTHTPQNNFFVVPSYQGNDRTLDQYLTDLKNDLDNGRITENSVISICQRIINSDNYKMNPKAIILREYAKKHAASKI